MTVRMLQVVHRPLCRGVTVYLEFLRIRNQNLKSRRQNGNIQNVPCFKPVTVKMSRPAVMPFEDDMLAGKAMDPAADVAVAGHKG